MGYAARTTYRKPSRLRRVVNSIVAWLAGIGLTPADTVRPRSRRPRRAEVSTKELAVGERAAVLAAYLSKRALSKSAAAAARDYFGLRAQPSSEALAKIAEHYPVFKVIGIN